MRFVSAVSSFVRQSNLDNLLRSNIPGAISQQQVRKTARDLANQLTHTATDPNAHTPEFKGFLVKVEKA